MKKKSVKILIDSKINRNRKKVVKTPIILKIKRSRKKEQVITILISGPQGVGKTIIAGLLDDCLSHYCWNIDSESYSRLSDSKLMEVLNDKKIIIKTTNL